MALLRQIISRSSPLVQGCCRLTASSIQQRAYADMSFTFASPGDNVHQLTYEIDFGKLIFQWSGGFQDHKVYYHNASVKQVDVPSFSGSFGILPEHVPTLAVMKPGVLSVFEEDGATKKYFVSSGSITINDDSSVQILAEEAHPLDRLDIQAVRDGLAKAQQEFNSAGTDKAKAEAQIAVECYEAIQKALE